ncbi:MAG: hypothetical protein RL758_721 [Pseudomonadota bacterium]
MWWSKWFDVMKSTFRSERQKQIYTVIFEADTKAGRAFDLWLIALILLSLVVVVLESVAVISQRLHPGLMYAEWLFTLLFTVEYGLRLYSAPHPWAYARSFFGVIDLLSILPTYLALFVPELHSLIDVRILRLLRVFRVLKLAQYMHEYAQLRDAIHASRRKIMVFLATVLMAVFVIGTLMYVIEGPQNGFTSIPTSVYWAITTMTTVGFGDITPKTDLGRAVASLMMLMGWGVLAVPTGIVTAEMVKRPDGVVTTRTCPACLKEGLLPEDRFCRHCGEALPEYQSSR